MKSTYIGIVYAILSSVAYGVMPIIAKLAYAEGSNPTTVILFRFYIALVLLAVYIFWKRMRFAVTWKQFGYLFTLGFFGYTITTLTLYLSYDFLGAGLATTLHFIYPGVVCLLGWLIFKERMDTAKWISLTLAATGVYLLLAFEDHTLNWVGVGLALFSGVTYGINVIALGAPTIKAVNSWVATFYLSLGAALGMQCYGLVTETIVWKFNVELLTYYTLLALVSTILAIVFLMKAIEIIGASSASILGTFEPVVSIVLGVFLFREPLSIGLILGTIAIICATIILAKRKRTT